MEPLDDEPDRAGTPPPPDQRPWRHPSEVHGRADFPANPPVPTAGRGRREALVAAGAGLFGAVAAGALLVLLLPSAGDGPTLVAPAASAPVVAVGSVVPTTVEEPVTPTVVGRAADEWVEQTTTSVPTPATTAPPSTSTPSVPTTNPQATPTTLAGLLAEPPSSPPWPTLAHNGAAAVPLADSGLFLTTATGADGWSGAYTVRWGGAQERLATVVAHGEGYAVLQLDRGFDDVTGVRVAVSAPSPGSWVTVWSTDRYRAVVVQRDQGLALAGVVADGGLEGAPVLDEQGFLVGLCTQRRGTTTMVPVVGLEGVIDERREAAWLGVAVTSTEVDGSAVVMVTEVTPDSPAARAGVNVDDVVVSFDGEAIDSVVRLADRVGARQPGDVVVVEVRRDDTLVSLEVNLASRPFSL